MHRIVIIGNSGSGKSTMAKELVTAHSLAHLDLDSLAWTSPAIRRPHEESIALLQEFLDTHPRWVVEGCYASLLEAVLLFASELRFLNPGLEACVRNCRTRPWEPHKFASKEEQDARLDFLLAWVQEYERREDEYSLAAHRRLYESFSGQKREYTSGPG